MRQLANSWEEAINYGLNIILEEAVFDQQSELIFRKYYGIHCERQELKSLSKLTKLPVKKLTNEINRIDNKVFNILKKHAILDELNAIDEQS